MGASLPPGFTLDAPPAQSSALPPGFTLDPASPPQVEMSPTDHALNALKSIYRGVDGGMEATGHLIRGAAAVPISGIAGLGTMATNALAGTHYDPSQTVQSAQSALTGSPQSDQGKAILGAVSKPLSKIGDAIDSAGQSAATTTGSPAYGAATSAVATALPDILGMELPAIGKTRLTAKADEAVAAIPRQSQIDAARKAGYPIPPSEISSAPVGKVLTGVAGKDQLNQAFSVASQQVTNKIAKGELPIPPEVPLSPGSVAKVIKDAGDDYDAIRNADQNLVVARDADGNIVKSASGKPVVKRAGAVQPDSTYFDAVKNIGAESENSSFGTRVDGQVAALRDSLSGQTAFTPADGLNHVKDLRFQAKANLKAVDDPSKLALGKAQMQAADAIEDQLERYLDKGGQSSLYRNFVKARTTIAKAKTIQENMDASGRVDASGINTYRNNGGRVEGGLKQIADAADSFPKTVRNTQGVQAPAPLSALDFAIKTGGIGGGASLYSHEAGAGAAAATAAALIARPAARGLLGSDWYQSLLRGQAPSAGPLSQLAAQPASPLAGLAATPSPPLQQ